MDANQQDLTLILQAVNDGDGSAQERLFTAVYDELKRIARWKMANEGPGLTLQPTALVHEAYLRLVSANDHSWANRAHFFSAAVEAMRRILIERYRKYQTEKHGGGHQRVPLHDDIDAAPEPLDIVALDEALTELAELDPASADVVRYRFFLGLTEDETADVLGVSRSTVTKQWARSKAWLRLKISDVTGLDGAPASEAPE
ncbi:MAG: ECF-type sigma factor [Planctomycetota bacterium]